MYLPPNVCIVLVALAIGIPTVKRDVQTYLLDTINSVVQAMTEDEKQDVVVVVLIAEVRKHPQFAHIMIDSMTVVVISLTFSMWKL